MLLKTVEFNEKNFYYDAHSKDCNLMYLRQVENHLRDILEARGYVYLNQICEYLGDAWDPGNDNPCIRRDGCHEDQLRFEIKSFDDGSFLVYIMNNE